MPTDLPPSLIDRNVTRVELDPRARFQYIEQYDVVSVLGQVLLQNVFPDDSIPVDRVLLLQRLMRRRFCAWTGVDRQSAAGVRQRQR